MPFASMTTTGAKSGEPRTAAVVYFNDGDDVILIASNYGGTRHPAWYHNLKANQTAILQRGRRSGTYVAAEVNDEADRERLFVLGDLVYPGYSQYRVRTATIGRRIPIMRLRPNELAVSYAARRRRRRRARPVTLTSAAMTSSASRAPSEMRSGDRPARARPPSRR